MTSCLCLCTGSLALGHPLCYPVMHVCGNNKNPFIYNQVIMIMYTVSISPSEANVFHAFLETSVFIQTAVYWRWSHCKSINWWASMSVFISIVGGLTGFRYIKNCNSAARVIMMNSSTILLWYYSYYCNDYCLTKFHFAGFQEYIFSWKCVVQIIVIITSSSSRVFFSHGNSLPKYNWTFL